MRRSCATSRRRIWGIEGCAFIIISVSLSFFFFPTSLAGFECAIEQGANCSMSAVGILSLKGPWVIDGAGKGLVKARENREIPDIGGIDYDTKPATFLIPSTLA